MLDDVAKIIGNVAEASKSTLRNNLDASLPDSAGFLSPKDIDRYSGEAEFHTYRRIALTCRWAPKAEHVSLWRNLVW